MGFLGIFYVLYVLVTVTDGFGVLETARDNARYANGDYYLDFNPEVYEVGVSSEGMITCGMEGGNFALCGESRLPRYSGTLEFAPIATAVFVLINVGRLARRQLRSGGKRFWAEMMVFFRQLAISAVFSTIVIASLNVYEDFMIETIRSSMGIGIIGVLKLLPTLMALYAFSLLEFHFLLFPSLKIKSDKITGLSRYRHQVFEQLARVGAGCYSLVMETLKTAGRFKKGQTTDNKIGVYVHIPFCLSKCVYCDFNTFEQLERLIPDFVRGMQRVGVLRR